MRDRNHLGDVLQALAFVRKQEVGMDVADLQRRIAALLGFGWRAEESTERPIEVRSRPAVTPAPKPVEKPAPKPHTPPTGDNDAWVDRLTGEAGGGQPEWYAEVSALEPTGSAADMPELALEPLLRRAWTRAILSAVLAKRVRDGEPDLERLVQELAPMLLT